MAVPKKGYSGRKSPQSEVPWVMTGAGTEAQYNSARRDARDHMRMRNTFFQQVGLPPQTCAHGSIVADMHTQRAPMACMHIHQCTQPSDSEFVSELVDG